MKNVLLYMWVLGEVVSALEGNYFDTIEKMFINEEGRQATNVLQEDLAGGFDTPKEISITYHSPPEIIIKDLTLSNDYDGSNICMTVKMDSPNFNFKLDVRCDEIEAGNFKYEGSASQDKNSMEEEEVAAES